MGLSDAVIAAQADWSEKSVTKMVETYAHAVDQRRLAELDAAFAIAAPRPLDGAEIETADADVQSA